MALTVIPLPQALGARVGGLEPGALDEGGLDDATVEALRRAWYENLVLFFPGLHLSEAQHRALGSVFGSLAATSNAGDDYRPQRTLGPAGEVLVLDGAEQRANAWHTDVTFTATPPAGALLSMQVCPAKGGDTIWTNQYAAYETLHPGVQRLIDGLDAVHGRPGMTGQSTHPMVLVHPVTGRRALFVNRGWTTRVVGMPIGQSNDLLQLLHNHAERPEHQVRWTWTAGDAALWDNRCTMHYAVDDYGDATRILHRVTIYS